MYTLYIPGIKVEVTLLLCRSTSRLGGAAGVVASILAARKTNMTYRQWYFWDLDPYATHLSGQVSRRRYNYPDLDPN